MRRPPAHQLNTVFADIKVGEKRRILPAVPAIHFYAVFLFFSPAEEDIVLLHLVIQVFFNITLALTRGGGGSLA